MWPVFWLFLLLLFLFVPLGYGMGLRRWGPPYPSSYQRRRDARLGPGAAADAAGADAPSKGSWGWIGDLVWLAALLVVVWVVIAVVA
jgi:hypothetical protein